MHLCNSLLIQGYSDSKVYITLATDNNFRILTTKDFSGIQPYVIRSFADGKYILIGGDSGQIIVLRREENSNNITNLKTFTFKDSENNLEGSIKDIIQVEYSKENKGQEMHFAICTNNGLKFFSMIEEPNGKVKGSL